MRYGTSDPCDGADRPAASLDGASVNALGLHPYAMGNRHRPDDRSAMGVTTDTHATTRASTTCFSLVSLMVPAWERQAPQAYLDEFAVRSFRRTPAELLVVQSSARWVGVPAPER